MRMCWLTLGADVAQCPICQTEYIEGEINSCTTCGWDLTPISKFLDGVPEALWQNERVKLAWARGVWSQLQMQSKLCELQGQMQQAKAERSHLQSQLALVFSLLEQHRGERLPDVLSAPTTLSMRYAQLRVQFQQAIQQNCQLQEALSQAQAQIGSDGLDLLIQALTDGAEDVQRVAYRLLRHSAAKKAKEALQRFKPYHLLICKHTMTEHKEAVRSVAISPDSQILASGSNDKTIKIWNLVSGKLLRTLEGHLGSVTSVAMSADGQTLASGSGDKTIKIWNLSNGELLHTLSGHIGWVHSLAISPNGYILASGSSDRTIKLWNVSNGELLNTFGGHSGEVKSVAISPDGRTLASGSIDRTIKIWDLNTKELLHTLREHSVAVRSVAISLDGSTLVSGNNDHTIKIWDLETGKPTQTLCEHSGPVSSVTISADGQILASGSDDNTIKIWNLNTGKLLRTLPEDDTYVLCVTLSPDGQTLVSGSLDATIKIWGV